jgi:predicted dehydrogenase
LLVGYHFRFHPGLQKAGSLLSEGAIGRPLSVRAQWGEYLPGWHPWEDYRRSFSARADLGGGVVLTLSHPLDYLRWLLGEVESLWAFTGRLSDLELDVEDNAEIGLRFAQGVMGSLHLDYNQQPPEHTLEIIGTRGTLRWDSADGTVMLYTALTSPGQANWQSFPVSSTSPGSRNFERNDLFLAEMRHFLQVMRGESQPVCSLQDGIQALRLAIAALQSAQDGCLIHMQAEAEI